LGHSFYKLGGIYSIVHIESGKLYIGSALLFYKRWSEHKINLLRNRHPNKRLQNSWNKYGEDAFKFEVIEIIDNPTKEILEQREQYWIDYHNSANRKIGFNIRKIAISNLGFKHSEETKQKMRLAHLGKKQSLEHIRNAAESHKGKKRTKKQIENISKGAIKGWTKAARKRHSIIQKLRWKEHPLKESTRQKCREASLKRWIKA
jgi:group I intron endonuclease